MAVSKHFTRARTIKGMEMKGKMFKAGDLWSHCFYCLRQKNILHASCRTVKLGVKKTMKKKRSFVEHALCWWAAQWDCSQDPATYFTLLHEASLYRWISPRATIWHIYMYCCTRSSMCIVLKQINTFTKCNWGWNILCYNIYIWVITQVYYSNILPRIIWINK